MTDERTENAGPRRRAMVGLVLAVVVAVVVIGQIRSDPAAPTTTLAPVVTPPTPPSSISTVVADSASTTVADAGATTAVGATPIPIAVDPVESPGAAGTPESFTLRVDLPANCVYLESGDGARIKPIWPFGSTLRSDPVQIVVDGNTVATEGETVPISGTYGAEITAEDPLACGATETWVVSP